MDSPKFIRLKQAINQRQQEPDPNSDIASSINNNPLIKKMNDLLLQDEEAKRRLVTGEITPLDVVDYGSRGYDAAIGAPTRSALKSLYETKNPVEATKAAYGQFLENPDTAPDFGMVGNAVADPFLIAGAAKAGVKALPAAKVAAINALKTKAAQDALRPLMNEAGVITKEGAGTLVGREFGLKEGDTLFKPVSKYIDNNENQYKYAGLGIRDMLGKSAENAVADIGEKFLNRGYSVVNSPSELKELISKPDFQQKISQIISKLPEKEKKQAMQDLYEVFNDPYTIGGVLNDLNLLAINNATPNINFKDLDTLIGFLNHEWEHLTDEQIRKILDNYTNYNEVDAIKLKNLKNLGIPGPKAPGPGMSLNNEDASKVISDSVNRMYDLNSQGKILEATKISNAIKGNHFKNYNDFELENTLRPLVETSKDFTKEELNLLKQFLTLKK